jgi:hypothetical protein
MQNTINNRRKKLIPKWIKFFGWLFLLMGAAVVVLPVFWAFNPQPIKIMLFGLEHYGSPFDLKALLISSILMLNAVAAYGLLFAKDWGIKVSTSAGWISFGVCGFTMAYALFAENYLSIRLELIALIPYLMKLREIAPQWILLPGKSDEPLPQA